MIINKLSSQNFLKYSRLELDDLPRRGLIAISGQNESGKSSIGETICFALFGRTFSVNQGEAQKLIRWGESRCSAAMEFTANSGQRYQVSRYLDRDGNHSARLAKADDPDNPVARGVDAVAEAMHGVLRFDYNEFIESFYLAQREITTPHPHSYAVKTMAGIAPLEACREEFQDDLQWEQSSIEAAGQKALDVEVRLEELAYDEGRLKAVEEERRIARDLISAAGERRQSLVSATTEFQESEPKLRSAENSRSTASGLRLLFLLLALATLGVWALLTADPDSAPALQVSDLLARNVPGWGEQHLVWVMFSGLAFAMLFVFYWARIGVLGGRISELRGAGGRLRDEMGELDEMAPSLSSGDSEAVPVVDDQQEAQVQVSRLAPELRDRLLSRIQEGAASEEDVREAVELETAWLDQAGTGLERRSAEAEAEIARQMERREQHNKFLGMKSAFEQQAEDHRHRLRIRELADELLLGASRHLSHHFNHNLRGLVGQTLPLFTDSRYEHLQIDENLTVRAFSSEKRDFMDLDEISSGTQRQIMLALRLALSQELINRAVKTEQFAFLDEPFAFFDDNRTRSSLSVLPELSDEITQIWVVAQRFPGGVDFSKVVECDRDSDGLTIGKETPDVSHEAPREQPI